MRLCGFNITVQNLKFEILKDKNQLMKLIKSYGGSRILVASLSSIYSKDVNKRVNLLKYNFTIDQLFLKYNRCIIFLGGGKYVDNLENTEYINNFYTILPESFLSNNKIDKNTIHELNKRSRLCGY